MLATEDGHNDGNGYEWTELEESMIADTFLFGFRAKGLVDFAKVWKHWQRRMVRSVGRWLAGMLRGRCDWPLHPWLTMGSKNSSLDVEDAAELKLGHGLFFDCNWFFVEFQNEHCLLLAEVKILMDKLKQNSDSGVDRHQLGPYVLLIILYNTHQFISQDLGLRHTNQSLWQSRDGERSAPCSRRRSFRAVRVCSVGKFVTWKKWWGQNTDSQVAIHPYWLFNS